jgi:dTDP-4-amino-4,6-dideoxygalactose transaminase
MGEIEAAIGIEQLKKMPQLTQMRTNTGTKLSEAFRGLKGLITPITKDDCTHVYYLYPFKINPNLTNVDRDRIVNALQSEGVPWIYGGYQLLHLLPMFQEKIAYGSKGFPWSSDIYKGKVSYKRGICPVAEKLHEAELVCLQICQHNYSEEETNLVIKAFNKIWDNLGELL